MIIRDLELLKNAPDWPTNLPVHINEPMARHTVYNVGGPADMFITVTTIEQLCAAVNVARENGIPYLVLGSGSNILVADKGIRGLVIANNCVNYQFTNGQLKAEAGTPLREVAQAAVERGLEGLEWATGIPGTVGGAVVGNAGAFGGYICDVLQTVTVLGTDGKTREVGAGECGFEYRHSRFKARRGKREVILATTFGLEAADKAELAERVRAYARRRATTQPTEPSAGSVFKRTAQYPAGFLIEQAGLKGTRVGDALISPKHANFIVNLGEARASDVKALIDLAQKRVWDEFGEKLELEIELVGEWEGN